MGVSEKSGFSIINLHFWGTAIFGNTHIHPKIGIFVGDFLFSPGGIC